MTERVSVVIPAYNAERFLAEAIHSVLDQTLPAYELIVVDDGSTDGTARIAEAFDKARAVRMEHRGVSAARNRGVDLSTGEFIAFLDADDTWLPARLERQLAVVRANPDVDVVMARQSYHFEGAVPGWFRGPTDGSSEPGYMPSNWLLRRATWERVGPFDPTMSHSEDTDWLARASDLGVRVEIADEPLVIHRIHDRNASALAAEVKTGIFRALRESVQRKHSRAPGADQ